jgi:hypothetical protein
MHHNAIANAKEHHQQRHHLLGHKFKLKFMNVGCVVVAGLHHMDMVDKEQ